MSTLFSSCLVPLSFISFFSNNTVGWSVSVVLLYIQNVELQKKMMSYFWVYSGNSILIRNHVLSAAAKHQYMRMVLGPQLCGTAAISMQTRYITNRQLLHWQHQVPRLPVELEHDKDFDV
jgi:hypothetical protein